MTDTAPHNPYFAIAIVTARKAFDAAMEDAGWVQCAPGTVKLQDKRKRGHMVTSANLTHRVYGFHQQIESLWHYIDESKAKL